MNQKEVWADVKGHEGDYKVSTLGRVKRFVNDKELIVKQNCSVGGYFLVNMCKNKKWKTRITHQLVAESFLGHVSGRGLVIDHIDNDKQNNALENLQLITQRENTSKDRKNGVSKYVGVSFHELPKKWRATIYFNGTRISLGYYYLEIDAHNAYQEKLKEIS